MTMKLNRKNLNKLFKGELEIESTDLKMFEYGCFDHIWKWVDKENEEMVNDYHYLMNYYRDTYFQTEKNEEFIQKCIQKMVDEVNGVIETSWCNRDKLTESFLEQLKDLISKTPIPNSCNVNLDGEIINS